MRVALVSLIIGAALSPLQAMAQARDFALPSGDEVSRTFSTLCAAEAQGANLGFAAREAGRTMEEVFTRFPEPADPALRSIFRGIKLTVGDVYALPDIGYFTMFFYRAKVCFRERTELRSLPPMAVSAAALMKCEKEHMPFRSPELLACVGQVVDAL